MSAKEDGAKDKKMKKKKTTKSVEGKAKEAEKKAVVKEEVVEENERQDTVDCEQNKGSDNNEDVTEKSSPGLEEAVDTTSQIKEKSDPHTTSEEFAAETLRGSEKSDGGRNTKEMIKSEDIERLIELKEAFSLFDFNHDGIIDLQDLKYTFATLGKPDFPEEEMQKMLKEAKEPVDFDAFVALFGYKVNTLDPEDVFTKALSTWDMRGIGMIPEERFKHDIQCFGDKFTGKEADSALEEAPVFVTEGTPMIDYVKFSSNVCGFRNVERTRKHQKNVENA